jgi:hypothetical protein
VFEDERKEGLHTDSEEPGDAVGAPYRKQHCIATAVERLLCAELGVDWDRYNQKLAKMP